jgi:mono/diheme cytochrome c family protein
LSALIDAGRILGVLVLKQAAWTVAILAVAGMAALAFAYSGSYDVAADQPHWELTSQVIAEVRERSVAVRAESVTVPNLADPALIALGAEHYAGMCTGCHLAPGMGDNEMRQGLYPKPPDLTEQRDRSPAQSFWIIKHGIKMSGMPAWGVTHDDEAIWGLVAFVQQLPTMDAAGYAALTGEAGGPDHDHAEHEHGDHDHGHGGASDEADDAVSMTGATMGAMAVLGHAHNHPDGEGHEH